MDSSKGQLLPVLPLRDIVVFPHMIVPLFVGREKSVRALEDVMAGELLWAAAKATLSGVAILVVISLLGFVASPLALWALPVKSPLK